MTTAPPTTRAVDDQIDVVQVVAQDRHAGSHRNASIGNEEGNHRPHLGALAAEPGQIREHEACDQGGRGSGEPAQLLPLLPREWRSRCTSATRLSSSSRTLTMADTTPTVDTSGLSSSARVIESIGTTRTVLRMMALRHRKGPQLGTPPAGQQRPVRKQQEHRREHGQRPAGAER